MNENEKIEIENKEVVTTKKTGSEKKRKIKKDEEISKPTVRIITFSFFSLKKGKRYLVF